MAITVGALVVDLSANSAAFKADLGKSAAALKSSSARMNRSLGKIDRGFLVLLGVAEMERENL